MPSTKARKPDAGSQEPFRFIRCHRSRQDISFTVNAGEIVSLIGANGAGKTTTLHTITGLVPAKSGSVMYNGVDLLKTHNNKIVTLGMAHIPEGRHVFGHA